ncbi:cytochrome c oxidase subunit 3 family protein (plasmid) [Diaphorobacter sp. HDW4B]|uniref:cytochrome c oxidase subunit 3 family protein n=1 Tax=Diaphorobacter sp. HDW4B TaxID=2714925 RepID=UPI00140AADD4|nr:cytochrome c oxidase subunit 3 family protein [Diaphorobacter sp. HDW4B]QIL74019.1 cytochrome c oxidase subunit 3 family protein [Diaphorobacter sp. HDW4B]
MKARSTAASMGVAAPGHHTDSGRLRVPGESALWLFLFGDILLFSVIFVNYMVNRGQSPAAFAESRAHLNQMYGLINTIVMLTSSWLVASAVAMARQGRSDQVRRLLYGAVACAIVFAVVKFFEYREKLQLGFTPMSDAFFSYYFIVTGIHLLHVMLGAGMLLYVAMLYRKPGRNEGSMLVLESGASFWHLVDLIWIFVFALIYLV